MESLGELVSSHEVDDAERSAIILLLPQGTLVPGTSGYAQTVQE